MNSSRNFIIALLFALLCSACNSSQPSEQLSPRFNHVYLMSADVDRSVAFYKKAFDLEVFDEIKEITRISPEGNSQTAPTHIVLLRFTGQQFNLEIGGQPDFVPQNGNASYTHIGIDVTNIEEASKRILEAGATSIRPIGTVKANDIEAKTAFFLGPDGETIELMQIIKGKF